MDQIKTSRSRGKSPAHPQPTITATYAIDRLMCPAVDCTHELRPRDAGLTPVHGDPVAWCTCPRGHTAEVRLILQRGYSIGLDVRQT